MAVVIFIKRLYSKTYLLYLLVRQIIKITCPQYSEDITAVEKSEYNLAIKKQAHTVKPGSLGTGFLLSKAQELHYKCYCLTL